MIEKSRIRVAFLAGSLGLGGSERQLFHIVTGLDKSKFEPIVLSLNPSAGDHWEARLNAAGIQVIGISKSNPFRRAWRIRQVTAQYNAEIIHSFHYFTNVYAAICGWKQKTTVIGNIRFWPSRERVARVGPVPLRWFCLYGVNILLCNSETIRQALGKRYRKLPTLLAAPNGVDLYSYNRLVELREQGRKAFRTREDDILIGFVGRLDDNKDPLLLLNAFSELVSNSPNTSLVFVGSGPLRASLEEQIKRFELQEKVKILGSRPNAQDLMPAFDILCLPSKTEGMPNSVMEASSAGVPIVASNAGGVREIVIDEITGFLFTSGNVDALQDKLQRLILDPQRRAKMGNAGRILMEEKFTLERMLRYHEQLYQELIEKQISGVNSIRQSKSSIMDKPSR